MQINLAAMSIKSATFGDTTNEYGHVIIDSNPNHVVVSACVDGGYINHPFKYSGNMAWYLHVMNIGGTNLANTAVTGTYYYLEM